nr:39S ribosomal protein L44, mitochondrial [Onthophagus taurus]
MLKSIQLINLFKLTLKSTNSTQSAQSREIKRWVAPTLRELQRRKDKCGPEKPEPRSNHLEWNYEAELFAFGKRLGEDFHQNLLKKALIQKEYARDKNENENLQLEDNSEMILNGKDIINNFLFKEFNKSYPDVIVKVLKDYLTREKILAEVAVAIGLKDIVLTKEFPIEVKTLSNTFCAIIAALEKSSGLDTTQKFLNDFLIAQLRGKELFDIWNLENPYLFLKDLLKNEQIEPRLCNQSGINTILANYQVGLFSEKKLLGIGFGENVEVAKNTAALDVLNKIYMKKKFSFV